jgi:hypothetical protein
MNKDKAYKEIIAEFRMKYFHEQEKSLKRLIKIRDGKNSKDKDVIDASKAISRMLGTLAPEKIEKKESSGGSKKEAPFTKAEEKDIDKRLASTLGDRWTALSGNT